MDFQQYIKAELLILIPVLNLIGAGLKKSKFRDKHIPWILGATAVTLSAFWVFSTAQPTGWNEVVSALFTAITQGILAAGASVYVNQLHRQAKKEE